MRNKNVVKIGIIQTSPDDQDMEMNLETAKEAMERLSEQGAKIILLPECSITGYDPRASAREKIKADAKYFEVIDKEVSVLAKKHHVYILIGTVCPPQNGSKPTNSVVIYDPAGKQIYRHDKIFPFENEDCHFQMGDQLKVIRTKYAKIGILICYDVGFPETSRELALQGAELIFIAAAWTKKDERAWELNIPSRALENHVFTVAANQAVEHKGIHLFGRSMVCNPWGKKIYQSHCDSYDEKVVEINLDEIKLARKECGYLRDLKRKMESGNFKICHPHYQGEAQASRE